MRTAPAAATSVSAVRRLPFPNWDIHLRTRPGDWDLARWRGRPCGERRLLTDAAAWAQGSTSPDGYREVSVELRLGRSGRSHRRSARRGVRLGRVKPPASRARHATETYV